MVERDISSLYTYPTNKSPQPHTVTSKIISKVITATHITAIHITLAAAFDDSNNKPIYVWSSIRRIKPWLLCDKAELLRMMEKKMAVSPALFLTYIYYYISLILPINFNYVNKLRYRIYLLFIVNNNKNDCFSFICRL